MFEDFNKTPVFPLNSASPALFLMLRAACRAPRVAVSARASLVCRRALSTKFSKDHEWVKVEADVATIGITDHAQEQLGDIVFVDLPEVGKAFAQDETFGAVESVKAASDVYSPISGEITEINASLTDEPSLVNSAAEADGWMVKMKLSAPAELDGLMDEAAYKKFCEDN